jgi:L-rhamnose-H+ transport protein
MNPLLGVVFHWLGGFASGSFYVSFRPVRNWSWETYWLVGGFFSWIIVPWLLASTMTADLLGVLKSQSASTLAWTYLFGVLWGFGGLTFGLTMRYLGLSLGIGMALGYCAAFGTLVPPIAKSLYPQLPINDQPFEAIVSTTAGQVTLAGIGICLVGIAITALAGLTKEREMPTEQKRETVKEFNFSRGTVVATFCGFMSACFAFGLAAAKPIETASAAAGTPALWTGLPKLVVVLLGGFTTNFIWCLILHFQNRSGYEYLSSTLRRRTHDLDDETILETAIDAPSEEVVVQAASTKNSSDRRIPLLNNYAFSAFAGTVWYMQFFFYTMGETQMGKYGFASWTLHMASIIIFSTAWGVYFKEWAGSSSKARQLISLGIALLVASTIVIGYGTWLKSRVIDRSTNAPLAAAITDLRQH